ncbi:MAG: dihydrofolate reductase family protein [Pseudomonadota bacterium]
MRQLAILSFVSLDGVMQAPGSADEDKSGGFTHGGWAAPYWEGVMPEVERVAMAQPYDILFGRRTYDIFAGHWPTAPRSTVSERLNASRKYVVTSSPGPFPWQNSVPVTGDIASKISALKAEDGPLIQVHGSAGLIQLLHREKLIDLYRIWTFPVVLGTGKRLFEPGCSHRPLTLDRVEHYSNGVTMQTYLRTPTAD